MSRRRALALALGCALVLGGCTGIPDTSTPQTVEPVRDDNGTSDSSQAPRPDASARDIVIGFLQANASEPGRHASARSFLTPTARNQWSDQRVTVISDPQVKTYDQKSRTVDVIGNVVGTINANGVYAPSLQGQSTTIPFKLTTVKGQYRIDQLRSGLLINDDQFRSSYQQRVVYYYDLAEKYLVPDVRWSAIALSDGTRLANWLVDQLVSAPRPELQDVVSTDTFPAQADPSRLSVRQVGGTARIEVPGSSQLERAVRNRLAAQLAQTLDEALSGEPITITDGGVAVQIPAVEGTAFTEADFPDSTGPATSTQSLYYLDAGRVYTENGKAMSGPLGVPTVSLSSVALARRSTSVPLLVAGTAGYGSSQQLVLGTQSTGVQRTPLRGSLTRPVWPPGLSEVWIGNGSTIHRVTVTATGRELKDTVVQLPPTPGGGSIRSLQFSPDGSQLALVVSGAKATSALYVGAVVRDAGAVRVSGLTQISPQGVVVLDAGWNNSIKLTAIGYQHSIEDGGVFDTYVDGSFWVDRGRGGLPAAPVNITVSSSGTWTESGGQVWTLAGQTWASPSPTGQTFGHRPAYLN